VPIRTQKSLKLLIITLIPGANKNSSVTKFGLDYLVKSDQFQISFVSL
jgi:hypothetical protein